MRLVEQCQSLEPPSISTLPSPVAPPTAPRELANTRSQPGVGASVSEIPSLRETVNRRLHRTQERAVATLPKIHPHTGTRYADPRHPCLGDPLVCALQLNTATTVSWPELTRASVQTGQDSSGSSGISRFGWLSGRALAMPVIAHYVTRDANSKSVLYYALIRNTTLSRHCSRSRASRCSPGCRLRIMASRIGALIDAAILRQR